MTKRILHLIKSLGRGGAEVLLAEGLAIADRERFRYEYGYFLPWKDAVVPALSALGAEVTCFEARSSAGVVAAARRVARHLRERRIELVHAHLPVAGIVARLAGRWAGVPVVYTEHNLQERYRRATRWLNKRTWPWQAQVIAVSRDVADSIARNIDHRVPVRTVHNGVNVRSFDPACYKWGEGNRRGQGDRRGQAQFVPQTPQIEPVPGDFRDRDGVRAERGIPADALVVGTIAVFRIQKRLGDWLAVARRVVDRVPNTHFLLVGDGPERTAVEAKVVELGLQSRVHRVGLQEDVRPYLAAMDVYLMTSQFEGLPIALLEAMSMGVPPVVTAVGGIPEVVAPGGRESLRMAENRHQGVGEVEPPPEKTPDPFGCLQPFGAIDALADDVVALLNDAPRREALGRAARATVVQRFSIERMQRELESIYERVLRGRESFSVSENDSRPLQRIC